MKEAVFSGTKKLEYSFLVNGEVGNMVRQHYHDGYEVYLHLSGERNVFFNNRKYILKKGSLFILEPFVLHMTTNAENAICSRDIVNFNRSMLLSILSEKEADLFMKEISSCIIQLNDEQTEIIDEIFKEIQMHWLRFCGGEKRCEKLAYMSVYRLVDRVLDFKSQLNNIIDRESLEIVSNSEIFDVLRYIEKNYAAMQQWHRQESSM